MQNKGNFLDEYVKYGTALTDAPEYFHRFMAYSVLSTMIERRVWMPFGPFSLYPNLWMILMGRSGGVRKTTSMNMGRLFVNRFKRALVMPDEFTQEGIFKTMGTQAQGTLYFSEFGAFLGMLDKDYMAGCKHFLTELYDCPDMRTKQLSQGPILIKDVYLDMVGCTTLEWFNEKLKQNDIAGGFLARFLLIPADAKTITLTMPPESNPEEEIKVSGLLTGCDTFIRTKLLGDKLNPNHRGRLVLSQEARKLYDAFYHALYAQLKGKDAGISAFFERLTVYALKLSMLHAINVHEEEISADSFLKAKKDIGWIFLNLNHLTENFTYSPQDQLRLKVLNFIKGAYPEPVRHSACLTNIRNITAKSLHAIITTLEEADRITIAKTPNGASKKSTLYKWNHLYK